jgi:hypothetical protein
MTANELATDLELQSSQMEYGYAVSDWKLLSDSATMLRQQQAEIEKLRKIVEGTIGQAFYEDDYHKAKVEIEALKKELALQKLSDIGQAIETLNTRSYLIGRYDGLRELTDEEIYALAVENGAWKSKESGNVYPNDLELLNFARAILKKASEK